ncbi:hypothetical protein AAEX28_15640 [Lentisphaerota bacterium WC36G]|nr:hypothetical protein LJT99_02400 [Lentisphaerae bacterium WC36]
MTLNKWNIVMLLHCVNILILGLPLVIFGNIVVAGKIFIMSNLCLLIFSLLQISKNKKFIFHLIYLFFVSLIFILLTCRGQESEYIIPQKYIKLNEAFEI